MRINNYKKFLESRNATRIGDILFPEMFIDSFLTSLEDSDVKYTIEYGLVPVNYRENDLSMMLTRSNGINNIDYKYCCKIWYSKDFFDEEVENLKVYLSDYDVYKKRLTVYIVSKEIVPLNSLNKQLQNEITNMCVDAGLDMNRFEFPENFPTFRNSIHSDITEHEADVMKKIIDTLSKKWVIRNRLSDKSVYIDLFLNILNQDIK